MKWRYPQLSVIYLAVCTAIPALAETPTDLNEITKSWKCKYCPDFSSKQWEGYLSASVGYVTNHSYKFGEYSGLYDKGNYVGVGFNNLYRDDDGNYWNIRGDNLGLESPYFGVEGGNQGQYKFNLEVDQLTRYALDTSRTPFTGNTTQTLPAGWVKANTTTGFAASLAANLHDMNLSTQRRFINVGGEYFASPNWSYEAWYKRQTKEGYRPIALGFGTLYSDFRSVTLAMPVNYTTNDIELKANYSVNAFHGQIALINSKFENSNKYFRWDNPFDPAAPDPNYPTVGQAATEPDNSKQQLLLSGTYSGINDVRLAGQFSYAQLSQNEAYLPYTVNTALTGSLSAMPQSSLNGKVTVINTNIAAHWNYSPVQTWHAVYEHHEQDNNTARNTYTYVTADTTVTSTPRANFPYGFRQQKLKIDTDYQYDDKIKLSGGGQLNRTNRDYQSVESSIENSLWGKLKQHLQTGVQYSVKAEVIARKINNYNVASEVTPADNALMRKYNMSNRNGRKVDFNLNYAVSEKLTTSFVGDVANFEYSDSVYGLKESKELTIGADMQFSYSKDLQLSAYVHRTSMTSQQASPNTPDWTADNDDKVITLGLSASYQIIDNKLKAGLDFVHTDANSNINISSGGAFPELSNKRDTITLSADYTVDKNLSFKASYQYERYDESNWYLDNVTPNTISEVLTLGNVPPHYKIGVAWITVRYSY